MRQGLKVSLIIPVYNESGKIRACMDNIAGVYGLHEVIFADGGSTDGTPDIIGCDYPAWKPPGIYCGFPTATVCCPKTVRRR